MNQLSSFHWQTTTARNIRFFQKLTFCVLALFLSHVRVVAADGDNTEKREIASPHPTMLPLIIPLERDVQAKVTAGGDFVLFEFEKKRGNALSAMMRIYVGHFPERLYKSFKDVDFVDDQPAWFARERAAWHVWITEVDGKKHIVCRAFLYNTYTGAPHWIVDVSINGEDSDDVKAFQKAAQKMVFKGLEKKPVANERK